MTKLTNPKNQGYQFGNTGCNIHLFQKLVNRMFQENCSKQAQLRKESKIQMEVGEEKIRKALAGDKAIQE